MGNLIPREVLDVVWSDVGKGFGAKKDGEEEEGGETINSNAGNGNINDGKGGNAKCN